MIKLIKLIKFVTRKNATAPIKIPTVNEPTVKAVMVKEKILVTIEPTIPAVKQESLRLLH